jgi:hypothetical protein
VQIRARLELKKRIVPLFDPSISLAAQRAELDKSGKRAVPLPGQQIEPISVVVSLVSGSRSGPK